MRRIVIITAALALGAGIALATPAGSAAAAVRGADAERAIDAARAHARLSGLTYEMDGELHQRNAAGEVAVRVEGRRVVSMVLRQGPRMRLLTPQPAISNYVRITREVQAAYGVPTAAFVETPVDPPSEAEYTSWFDPFAQAIGNPAAEVVVDEAGRATEVRVGGDTTMRVIRWSAPLAARPPRGAVISAETGTMLTSVGISADFSYALLKQLAAITNRDAAYTSDPVTTLRRAARNTGWRARNSNTGVTITTTDALGATWRAVLVAPPSGVRIEEFTLTAHRPAVPREEARARLSLSVMAMGQSDLLSCPTSCRLTGKPVRLTVVNAETRILDRLGTIGITGQTPGPTYPTVGAEMIGSFGLSVADGQFRGGFSVSMGGYCLVVPLAGPGVLPRPTVYRAVPGSVGPLGTCRA